MKKLIFILALCSTVLFVSCSVWKDLNNVPLCSEPGLFIDLNKKGHYRVNGNTLFNEKPVTRRVADSICIAIKFRTKY